MGERIFIFGASGHGKVAIETARRAGYEIGLVMDDAPNLHGTAVLDLNVTGGRQCLGAETVRGMRGLIAIGNNRVRLSVLADLAELGADFISITDPTAVISPSANVGPGTLVLAQAAINAEASVGAHVIVNTAASIDHDCKVEDGAHLAPGVRLCGGVRVGRGALIGVGAVVIPGITIGAWSVVGAGAVVTRDLPAGVVAVGNPCRILESK